MRMSALALGLAAVVGVSSTAFAQNSDLVTPRREGSLPLQVGRR